MDAQSVVFIVLAVLLLASFVIAYFSSRTWHIGNVIVVYLIFLASGFFTYLAAKTLKIHATYRTQVNRSQADLDRLMAANEDLEFGKLPAEGGVQRQGGIRQVRHELDKLAFTRGRVWRGCRRAGEAAADGSVKLSIAEGGLQGLKEEMILFAFEEGPLDQGSHYVGEFKVTAIDAEAKTATLKPAMELTEPQQQRLTAGSAPWSLYEVMPLDQHELLQTLDEAKLRAALPSETVVEYLRDGKPAGADDPERRVIGILKDGGWGTLDLLREQGKLDQVVEKRYSRELRDYQLLFRELARQRAIARDRIAQLERDLAQLEGALVKAKADVEYREDEKVKLGVDLRRFEYERDLINHHFAALQAQQINLQTELAKTLAEIGELSAQLARFHREMERDIDQRSGIAAARERVAGKRSID